MMLQVDLVRHRAGAGLAWEIFYRVIFIMDFYRFVIFGL